MVGVKVEFNLTSGIDMISLLTSMYNMYIAQNLLYKKY